MKREELIESLPNIPYWDFWTPYMKPCSCGGMIIAFRNSAYFDDVTALCTRCTHKIVVSKPYIKPMQNKN